MNVEEIAIRKESWREIQRLAGMDYESLLDLFDSKPDRTEELLDDLFGVSPAERERKRKTARQRVRRKLKNRRDLFDTITTILDRQKVSG